MEVWYAELREEKQLLEAIPLEDFFTVPTQMVPDQSVLITVVDEQRAPCRSGCSARESHWPCGASRP
eukprot:2432735-Pyramimonas_sp.AAC.1